MAYRVRPLRVGDDTTLLAFLSNDPQVDPQLLLRGDDNRYACDVYNRDEPYEGRAGDHPVVGPVIGKVLDAVPEVRDVTHYQKHIGFRHGSDPRMYQSLAEYATEAGREAGLDMVDYDPDKF